MGAAQAQLVGQRFEVQSFAGVGGMGSVFRALDLSTGKPVAVKLVNNIARADLERFTREAEVLSKLDHPGIVRYVAHGCSADSEPFLAVEWLEGHDLGVRLDRGPLTVHETLQLASSVALALGYAHEQGVVHRDVKPSNLFLVGGSVKDCRLVDFGIARVLASSRPTTRTGVVLGSIGYMAPEQARGEKHVGARADVFSLGCVLFECLAGRPAFSGMHALAILAKILMDEPPALRSIAPHVPAWFSTLIASMLNKDPDQRPCDGADVAARLAPHGATDPPGRISARPPNAALSTGERRLVSVIIVEAERHSRERCSSPSASTVMSGEAECETGQARILAGPFGGQVEMLADGSMVITLQSRGSATDQARSAARLALLLRQQRPSRPIVLATGRAVMETGFPVGDSIDRAAALLRGALQPLREKHSESVLIDDTTAGLLDVGFDVKSDGGYFVLRGEHRAAESTRMLLGKPTLCVGRQRELGVLSGIFEECLAEPGARAMLVTAPAGMGKSRLRKEFLERSPVKEAGAEVFLGRCDAMTAAAPLAALATALRSNAGIVEGQPHDVKQRQLWARIARNVLDHHLVRVAELLGEMTGIHVAEAQSQPLRSARAQPERMLPNLQQAWVDFISAEASAAPVILVVEDLHWAHPTTVDFIDAALRAARDRPLFVLALARPEVHDEHPNLWGDHTTQELVLSSLSRKASERLVRQVLGERTAAETIDRITTHANGNPLHLEELIRAVAEGRDQTFPGSIVAMVDAWLGALPAELRRVLRAAAVFGPVFWPGGVETLLGPETDPQQVRLWLDELVEHEAIAAHAPSRFPGELEFRFRHDLVREAAYQMLTDADRKLGHSLAAEWLDGAAEAPTVIVEHLARSADPQAMIAWLKCLRLRVRAERVAAYVPEIADRLLPVIDQKGGLVPRISARVCLASMMGAADMLGSDEELIEAAERLCVDPCKMPASVLLVRAELATRRSEWAAAQQLLQQVSDCASLDEDEAYGLEIGRAAVFGAMGQQVLALQHLDRAAQLASPDDRARQVELEKERGLIAYGIGDFARAVPAFEREAALCQAAGFTYERVVALHNMGDSLMLAGDTKAAERVFAEATELADRHHLLRLASLNRMYLAYLRASGRVAEAIGEIRAAIRRIEASGEPGDALNGQCLVAKLLVDAKDPDARAAVLEFRERAIRTKDVLFEAEANAMLNKIEKANPTAP
jgi:eukaryotic-like serine/threonine-protein kinase